MKIDNTQVDSYLAFDDGYYYGVLVVGSERLHCEVRDLAKLISMLQELQISLKEKE